MEDLIPWSKVRFEEINRIVEGLATLTGKELVRAQGPTGDMDLLVFTARSIAGLYQDAIEWGLRVRRVVAAEDVKSIVRTMERFVDDILEKIEMFGPLVLREVDSLVEASGRGEPPEERSLILSIELPGLANFLKALGEYTQS